MRSTNGENSLEQNPAGTFRVDSLPDALDVSITPEASMSRQRTFAFEGWVVSVVPERQIHRVDRRDEVERTVRSAEASGGARALFDTLGI